MSILRADLLHGRSVAVNVAGELSDALERRGIELTGVDGAPEALVHDARRQFAEGGAGALQASLETMWETIAHAANEAFIPSGRGGKVILIAPEDGAGPHADAARAATENLARTLSTEWARYAITTTALTPQAGTAEDDLALLVTFLLSVAGDYYTGARFELRPR